MLATSLSSENAPIDPREARAERRVVALETLARIGMDLAEALGRRVAAAVDAGEVIDGAAVALEYARLARAVRQTLALEARMDEGRDALGQRLDGERKDAAARTAAIRRARYGITARLAHAAVSQAIEIETLQDPDEVRAERLDERLLDDLEDPDEMDAIADLPVSAVIARICADLGVPVDWSLWAHEDWALEERRTRTPGSPYARDRAVRPEPAASTVCVDPPGGGP